MGKHVGLLAALLVMALGSGAVAQSPSPEPPPWFGGRVEMPEQGFAIAFPDDWVAFDLTADISPQVASAYAEVGDAFSANEWATRLDLRSRQERETLLAMRPGAGQACGLMVFASDGIDGASALDLSDEVAVARLDAIFGTADSALGYTGLEPIDLPGGQALTADWDQTFDDSGGADAPDLPHTIYIISEGGDAAMLTCEGWSRPHDDWLSIAETFEFLSVREEGNASLPASSQRLRVPGSPAVAAVPADWSQFKLSWDDGRRLHPTSRLRMWTSAHAITPDEAGGCGLYVYPSTDAHPIDLDEEVAAVLEKYRKDETLQLAAPAPSLVRLPAGEALHAHVLLDGATHIDHYFLADRAGLYRLSCSASERSDDRWLSIAETFEFLPDDE